MPHSLEKFFYCLFFLLCAQIISGLHFSLQRIGRMQTKEELKRQGFSYLPKLLRTFVSTNEWDALWYTLNFSKLIFYLIFGISCFFFLFSDKAVSDAQKPINYLLISSSLQEFFVKALVTILITLFADFLIQFICARKPKKWFKILSIPSSVLLTLTLPLNLVFLKIITLFFPKKTDFSPSPSFRVHDKILEWLRESEVESLLEKNEKKLIYAVISFKDRIAREVMVPRIRVFSLSSDTSIAKAAKSFLEEGYSRIPVYEENVDTIIGVILYKDVLNYLVKHQDSLDLLEKKTIKCLLKPVLYTPETKKISVLLQEFRSKKIHLAIVVDEYGGTEGIVTIEDILEELVGEIEDEYDTQTTEMISELETGEWVIEAKMSIIDLEEEIGIQIPLSPEYDTVGGFVFHKAGAIPSIGWKVHLDQFDLEVLSSDERSVNKIKITPHKDLKRN